MRNPKKLQCCLFLGCAVLLVRSGRLGATGGHEYDDCGQICGYFTDCSTLCTDYEDEAFNTDCGDFDGGLWDGWCESTCGDGICVWANGENIESCPEDCDTCGDGVCSATENCETCPTDCGSCEGRTPTTSEIVGAGGGCSFGMSHNGTGQCCLIDGDAFPGCPDNPYCCDVTKDAACLCDASGANCHGEPDGCEGLCPAGEQCVQDVDGGVGFYCVVKGSGCGG